MSFCLNARAPGGDPDLLLDQVDARHLFRDRMLHLDSGVHFEEVVFVFRSTRNSTVPAFVYPAFLMSRTAEPEISSRTSGDMVWQGLLDQFLVPTLQRAARSQMDGVAVGVGDNLHLDMPADSTYFSI